jgi:hypothetical protein
MNSSLLLIRKMVNPRTSNCLAASAESAIHTSLGQRPRIMAGMNGRAEGPIHKSLWRGLSALKQLTRPFPWGSAPGWYISGLRPFFYCLAMPHG